MQIQINIRMTYINIERDHTKVHIDKYQDYLQKCTGIIQRQIQINSGMTYINVEKDHTKVDIDKHQDDLYKCREGSYNGGYRQISGLLIDMQRGIIQRRIQINIRITYINEQRDHTNTDIDKYQDYLQKCRKGSYKG